MHQKSTRKGPYDSRETVIAYRPDTADIKLLQLGTDQLIYLPNSYATTGACYAWFRDQDYSDRGDSLRAIFCQLICRDGIPARSVYAALSKIDCFFDQMPDDFQWVDREELPVGEVC